MRSQRLSRWLTRTQVLVAVGLLLALAACGPNEGTGTQVTTTPTNPPPTATPTLAPPVCGPNFTDPAYYSTLPGATFQTTNVFAQVPMPPMTRAYDDDASGGLRGRHLCSAGDTASVQTFMTTQLTQLGWQTDQNTADCTGADGYGQPQCWKNGTYTLSMGINSSTDWLITFRDPDFVAGATPSFQVTSVTMAVSPTSIAGLACGTQTTVTYTATFHIAPGGPGGTIQFTYTINNGRGETSASLSVAPGQTIATYSFTWSGPLPADHVHPEAGGVMVSSPNQIISSLVGPTGSCS